MPNAVLTACILGSLPAGGVGRPGSALELRRGDVAVGWVREGVLEEAGPELNLELLKILSR